MTQEEKQLLLIDICGRLPYSTKVFYEYVDDLDKKTYGYSLTLNTWCINELIAEKAIVKPYLRSMSSMTEEEENELRRIRWTTKEGEPRMYEWCDYANAHHLDYRGLIPMGLAIAVTRENNPYEN